MVNGKNLNPARRVCAFAGRVSPTLATVLLLGLHMLSHSVQVKFYLFLLPAIGYLEQLSNSMIFISLFCSAFSVPTLYPKYCPDGFFSPQILIKSSNPRHFGIFFQV